MADLDLLDLVAEAAVLGETLLIAGTVGGCCHSTTAAKSARSMMTSMMALAGVATSVAAAGIDDDARAMWAAINQGGSSARTKGS